MEQIPADRQSDVPQITHTQLPDNAALVDVREAHEWAAGRAPSAVHIPLSDLPARIGEIPTEGPVYVVCRSGQRSSRAVAYLRAQGIDAHNLDGGMKAWKAGNRPMTHDGSGAPDVA